MTALLGRADRHAIWAGSHWVHRDGPVPWADHLAGRVLAGAVYGGCPESDCLGWDIDAHDDTADATGAVVTLLTALRPTDAVPLITTSKSGAGYHVRLFLTRQIPTDTARELARVIRSAVDRPAEMCSIIPAREHTPKGSGGVFGLPFAPEGGPVREGGCTLLDPWSGAPISHAEALDALSVWPTVKPEALMAAFPLPAQAPTAPDDQDGPEPAPPAAMARALAYARKREVGAPGSPDHKTLSVALFAWSIGCNPEQRLAVLAEYNARRPQPWPPEQLARFVEAPRTFGRERGWRLEYERSIASLSEPLERHLSRTELTDLGTSLRRRKTPQEKAAGNMLLAITRGDLIADAEAPEAQVRRDLSAVLEAIANRHPDVNGASLWERHFAQCRDARLGTAADTVTALEPLKKRALLELHAGGGQPAPRRGRPPAPPIEPGDVRIVARNGRYYVSTDAGLDYRRQYCQTDLPLKARDLLSLSETPKFERISGLIKVADVVEATYCQSETTFDAETGVLRTGLRLAGRVVPCWDASVDTWLRALAGNRYPALEQQLSACAPAWLGSTCRMTFLWGAPGCGKTVLVQAIAAAWGTAAVDAGTVVSRFNGALGACPIVLAEEEIPLALTGEKLREFVASHSQWIELKGQERTQLTGCARLWVTANSLDKIDFQGRKTMADIEAIAARVCEIPCQSAGEAALEALRCGANVDLDRITAHILALWGSVAVGDDGRFVGAGATGTEVEAILDAELEDGGTVWEAIGKRLRDRERCEAAYSDTADVGMAVPGRPSAAAWACWPIMAIGGELCVRPTVLEAALGMRRDDLRRVLAPARRDRCTVHALGKLRRDIKTTLLRTDVAARAMGMRPDELTSLLERDSRG
jgi:hypothetical protein